MVLYRTHSGREIFSIIVIVPTKNDSGELIGKPALVRP